MVNEDVLTIAPYPGTLKCLMGVEEDAEESSSFILTPSPGDPQRGSLPSPARDEQRQILQRLEDEELGIYAGHEEVAALLMGVCSVSLELNSRAGKL